MKILIHGGAANITDEAQRANSENAVQDSLSGLGEFKSALDIAEQAVANLELHPALNAGYGSVIQMDGTIRMDAGICSSTHQYAAVMQIENVKTPIRVARKLLDFGYHSILSGQGACAFAREQGFAHESPYTKERLQEYHTAREDFPHLSYNALTENMEDINLRKLSTVGAVVLDDHGNLAAACSTGGTKYCYPGRVGDTPVYGAGVYCSQHIAIACTGEGDKLLRRLTARSAEDYYLKSGDLQGALDKAIHDLETLENGLGGMIAINAKGEMAYAHNTPHLFYAHMER